MSYEAVDIKDRVAVGDDCFQLIKLSDGRYRLVPAPDSITEVGTNVDRALLYPMSRELERLSESLPETTASDAGKAIVVGADGSYTLGEAGSKDAVLYTEQTLTGEQQSQARENIDAAKSGHTQAASTISAGTFAGDVAAPAATDMSTPLLRNAVLTTTDPGAGTASELPEGTVVYVYE